jgi:hypothetical protein
MGDFPRHRRQRTNRSRRRKVNLTIAAYVRISEKLIDVGVLPNDHLDRIMDWRMREHAPHLKPPYYQTFEETND